MTDNDPLDMARGILTALALAIPMDLGLLLVGYWVFVR